MPSKSLAMHGAMCAAAHGRSTLGIPKVIGEEFCTADRGKHFTKRKSKKRVHLRRKS